MTYFGFLLRFLVVPLVLFGALTVRDLREHKPLPADLRGRPPLLVVLVHATVALIYTTPWDNYLVATGVWYYKPALVAGITLGWVPIEEYTFFVLQTLLSGMWLVWLARRMPWDGKCAPDRPRLRLGATAALGAAWLTALGLLVSGWRPGTYMALILVWALPPIMLQLLFGADLLWQRRGLVVAGILTPTLYLATTDSLAIEAGTWTISPAQSSGLLMGGVLPLEEFIFFLVTNVLIGFGMVLFMSTEGRNRIQAYASGARHLLRRN